MTVLGRFLCWQWFYAGNGGYVGKEGKASISQLKRGISMWSCLANNSLSSHPPERVFFKTGEANIKCFAETRMLIYPCVLGASVSALWLWLVTSLVTRAFKQCWPYWPHRHPTWPSFLSGCFGGFPWGWLACLLLVFPVPDSEWGICILKEKYHLSIWINHMLLINFWCGHFVQWVFFHIFIVVKFCCLIVYFKFVNRSCDRSNSGSRAVNCSIKQDPW